MSKFAGIIYDRLRLTCINCNQGCNYEGNVDSYSKHEPTCQYELLKWTSPIWRNFVQRKDSLSKRNISCSMICKVVSKYYNLLQNSENFVKDYAKFVSIVKRIVET